MSTGIELSVLVPCLNEEDNLETLVARTRRVFDALGIRGEIVLVDDGSTDGTAALVDALATRHANVVAVHHPVNRGIPAGWQSAFERSRGAWVCTIDADLQYRPEDIAALHAVSVAGDVDLIQGRRAPVKWDWRYLMSYVLDVMLRLAFAMPGRDVKSGFVVYRREAFADILRDADRFRHFQHMITVVAKARGYVLGQVEVPFEVRRAGRSFIGRFPLRMMIDTVLDIGGAVVAYRLRARGRRRSAGRARRRPHRQEADGSAA